VFGRTSRLAMPIALSLALALPVLAQAAEITPVVEGGLDAPRGLAFGSDGTLYVAEAGAGGTEPCLDHPELGNICFGASGSISAVVDGQATRVIEGLPSGLTATGEVIGASDVVVDDMGGLWFSVGLGASGEFRESIADGEGLGHLYKADGEGGYASVADLVAFEVASNPDAAQPGNAEPDSNANGFVLIGGGAVVADAGGNSLVSVDADGDMAAIAVFPITMTSVQLDPEAEAEDIPVDPVPTSVAIGPDGAYYVGMLTGFPFLAGTATVERVVPGEAPTTYAGGFTNIMDVAFGPDGTLYVLEIAHAGLTAPTEGGPPMGGLWSVAADGGEPQLIASDGLVMPGGLAVDADGVVYVSTCSVCPGGGGIVSVTP